ncbi:MAG: hypothetical protein ACLQLC_16740 [Candidatus Sulfotelmatobacter sp.]
MGLSVVVVESDPKLARSMVSGLSSDFHFTYLTCSGDELRQRVASNQPQAVVLDMECSRLADVRNLHHDFPSLPIVCTHRIPDEKLWIAALDAGAADLCPTADVNHALNSVVRSLAVVKAAAA